MKRCGTETPHAVRVPSSKSAAHRLLICAALSEGPSTVSVFRPSADVEATVSCLNALGARIVARGDGADGVTRYEVTPLNARRGEENPAQGIREFHPGESGSTLRFLLPVAAALGVDACFVCEGRLPERPLGPLLDVLRLGGVTAVKEGNTVRVSGRLQAGEYALPGNVSSQFVSGMLLALPLADGLSTLKVEGRLESADYVKMTLEALKLSGIEIKRECSLYRVPGGQQFRLTGEHYVGGDWSGAAFMLCAGAASGTGVTVLGLDTDSAQGDRRILEVLEALGAEVECRGGNVTVREGTLHGITLDASDIPDLVPAIAALAAQIKGETVIKGAARLRYKESDRLETTAAMLRQLGGSVTVNEDGLTIIGRALTGGNADSFGDHRIAMAAAVASMGSALPVTVNGAECVTKSYPGFWEDFHRAMGI